MSTTPARYRLVIFEPIAEPQEVRDLFCRVIGIHPTDAMQWLARAPGTWPKPLEEAEVRQLLDGLFDLKIAAEAWRSDLFPELSPGADGPSRRLPRRRVPHRGPPRRADPLGALGPGRADLRRTDRGGGRVPQRPVAGMALDDRRRLPGPGADEAPLPQPTRPRDPHPPRPRRRGDHRPPRAQDRLPRRREPDELRLPWRTPEPDGRRQLPGVRRRPLRPGRRGLHHPLDAIAARGPGRRR